MPEITTSHYAVVVSIGKTSNASTVGGSIITLGGSGATAIQLTSTGVATYNSGALNSIPTLNPATLTTANKDCCMCALYDFTDATSPRIERVISNNNFTDAVSTSFNTVATTTTSTDAITPGQMVAGITSTSLTTAAAGARQRVYALFLFTTAISFDELKLACIEMARTGELYAGWRNKA